MNPSSRVEIGTAMVATVISNVHGNRKKITDFMPNYKSKEKPLSLEEAFGQLKAVKEVNAVNPKKPPKPMRLKADK